MTMNGQFQGQMLWYESSAAVGMSGNNVG